MGKGPTPLDAASNEVAACNVGHRGVILQEGEAAGLEVTLRHETISHRILAIAQVAVFETTAICDAGLQALLEADVVELAAPGEVDVANLVGELHLQEVAGLPEVEASQLQPHVLEGEGLYDVAILQREVDLALRIDPRQRPQAGALQADGGTAFGHPKQPSMKVRLLTHRLVKGKGDVPVQLGLLEDCADKLPVLPVLIAAPEGAAVQL
mmetsp:Transcript_37794/g.90393  ORF Transcript_37794/g.90393 Transcript_37794/m.90393 type:complete len:210 (-) Transcript_37794:741-1370(-)